MMAVWLALPPASVANAWTLLVSRAAVSLGVKSCARTTTGSVKCWSCSRRCPSKFRRIRFSMSKQVNRPAGKIAAIDALQRLRVAAHDAADRVFGGVPLIAHHSSISFFSVDPGSSAHERRRLLRIAVQFVADNFLLVLGFVRRGGDRLIETLELVAEVVRVDESAGDAEPFRVQDHGWPMATPGDTGMPRLISMRDQACDNESLLPNLNCLPFCRQRRNVVRRRRLPGPWPAPPQRHAHPCPRPPGSAPSLDRRPGP